MPSIKAQKRTDVMDGILDTYTKTVYDTLKTEFYLVKTSDLKNKNLKAVRKINEALVIVKKNLKNDLITLLNISNNDWKISSKIAERKINADKKLLYAVKTEAGFDYLNLFNNNKNASLIRGITSANIYIIQTTLRYVLDELISNEQIEFVDLVEQNAKEETPIRQFLPELSRVNAAKQAYSNFNGDGIFISIKENAINESSDIDLFGKITVDENSSMQFTQHAKEMGTLVAGSGNTHRTGEGIVPEAHLISTDFKFLFAESEDYYKHHKISVQNHSYGTGVENYYGTESISYDQIVNDLPELNHVFSAGNAGTLAPESGTYQGIDGYANLTGNFKQSKNVLVVAALDSTMNHVSLTSSGPTYDGRIKPELATFGGEGTSESAATVSGAVAMLQDYYIEQHSFLPSSSLVKSTLIAAANEAHTKGIDFRTGYGSLNLKKSLQLLDSGWYMESIINSNDAQSLMIDVPTNSSEFKVVVSWIDPAANPEDAFALVNDLDVSLKDPNDEVWLPWVLDHSPNQFSLSSLPTRGEDHLNNVEMISLDHPVAGSYAIRINTNALSTANQLYSVAYYIKKTNHFEWSYPLAIDKLEGGIKTYLRWENTYSNQRADISIKYGNGTWELLNEANITDEQSPITIKDTTAFARLKMEIDGKEYVSDRFNINKSISLNIENDCATDFTLSWNKLDHTESYNLYSLLDNKLVSILNTTDTSISINKIEYPAIHYAVAPVSAGLEGLRSFSLNYENGKKGCYITNFLANLDVEDFINIVLNVNVPYQIDQITIFRESDQGIEIYKQFAPINQTNFLFEDHNLKPGFYTYYAELKLTDGNVINSSRQSLFYTDKSTVISFPNPVLADGILNILNDYPGGLLQLIDSKGNFIKSFDLVNTVEEINLYGLKKGIYIYHIIFENQIVHTGRLARL